MATVEMDQDEDAMGAVVVRVSAWGEGDDQAAGWARLEPGASMIVGTATAADLRVREPTVSKRHLSLAHDGYRIVVTDLGSKNGTSLLGHRVDRAEVGPGARLLLGRAQLDIARPRQVLALATGRPLAGVVGRSMPMLELADRVRRLALLAEPVLIRGESGTGKELVARALHDESGRAGAFVAINAATLSRELAESELFGHRRGAFTGACSERRGAFREADQGTLFIDETAQLGLEVQAKLLRAVEDGKVRPLGADGPTRVDVRVVAATSEPLEAYVDDGRFRGDLYERIAVCVVRVPPLSERMGDLPDLVAHLARKMGIASERIARSALRALAAHSYRGNVRELRNLLLHASIAAGDAALIDESHVAMAWQERTGHRPRLTPGEAATIVEACNGNISEAARRAGLARSTLRDRIALRAGVGSGLGSSRQ